MTKRALTALILLLLVAALVPAASYGAFAIEPGSVQVHALDGSGNPDNRAGAHPDRIVLDFNIETTGVGTAARDLLFEFAPGLTGSPIATKTCSRAVYEFEECPEDTQVGKFSAKFTGGESFGAPIFNITPAPGQLAALAFKPFWETELEMKLRPNDYGLDISTDDMPQLPFNNGHVELWGVPADHNGSAERLPFLTTPTECGPMGFVLSTRSWAPAAPWLSEGAESDPFEGCESLPFRPSLGLHLSESSPDSPTGARIDLNLPELNDPDGTAGANIKQARIDFPPGLTVAPAGVQGRQLCTDAQFGLGTGRPVTCPFHSRVGSVEIRTPQIAEELVGSIYLGEERPGERFRLLIHASARGVDYKVAAQLATDAATGQISTDLRGLPSFALSQISLNFEGGPHALLATPLSCGPATAHARFVPDSGGPAVESSSTVNIGTPCGGSPPYSPGLSAGSTDVRAGGNTGFALTLTRGNGQQLPGKFSTTLPPGLTANLRSVEQCPSSSADAGACPQGSRIGAAQAEVGSGPDPASVSGSVYLTEPYKDAPFGLAIVFRAAIGPFDLGTFVVRGTLRIDPHTGQITIEHLLPAIFEGVPLRFRTIAIDLNRPGFLVNPTSCQIETLASTVWSVDGRAADVSGPFNVGSCEALRFRPRFAAALRRRGRFAGRPELSFRVGMPEGDANLQRFRVEFPRVLKFHNSAVWELCPRDDALEDRCRPGSRVGTGAASTPLLNGVLRGPVYLVQSEQANGFPDLWANVEGMGVKLQLKGRAFARHGRLNTELVDIPDLPLSNFTMRVSGGAGRHSLFSLGRGACRRGRLKTPVALEGHEGATRKMTVQLGVGCPKSGSRKRQRRGHPRKRSGHRRNRDR